MFYTVDFTLCINKRCNMETMNLTKFRKNVLSFVLINSFAGLCLSKKYLYHLTPKNVKRVTVNFVFYNCG